MLERKLVVLTMPDDVGLLERTSGAIWDVGLGDDRRRERVQLTQCRPAVLRQSLLVDTRDSTHLSILFVSSPPSLIARTTGKILLTISKSSRALRSASANAPSSNGPTTYTLDQYVIDARDRAGLTLPLMTIPVSPCANPSLSTRSLAPFQNACERATSSPTTTLASSVLNEGLSAASSNQARISAGSIVERDLA